MSKLKLAIIGVGLIGGSLGLWKAFSPGAHGLLRQPSPYPGAGLRRVSIGRKGVAAVSVRRKKLSPERKIWIPYFAAA